MKKWTQIVITATAVTTALVVGLSASSSAGAASPQQAAPTIQSPVQPAAFTPQTNPESLFKPVAPCRIVDTRLAGGSLGNGTTRTYFVGGTTGFAPQGGKSGGCGVPVGATAVAAVITAVTPVHLGYFKAYPAGTTAPNSSVLNYPAGITIGSGVTLPLKAGVGQSLTIYNFNGPTQMIIDVQGYYIPQVQALVASDGSLLSSTPRVVSVSHPGTGIYYVTLDRPARECSPNVSTFNLYRYASVGLSSSNTPNVITVYVWYLDSTTHLENPTNYDFFLNVTC
ncbi:hypothetical protein ABIB25_003899 [Nakamurella sp. UYEF19]|uniref:hypothetical protein n=1 Tax=Nakamurella sp. UYEF19 TaxID=1756392 RepID=UPI0033949A24